MREAGNVIVIIIGLGCHYTLTKNRLVALIQGTNSHEVLKVKVPIIFLGTVGFSLRRDGRYARKAF